LSLTRIVVADGRTELRHGVLRAQQSAGPDGSVRIGLLAATALLLGGDAVELEVTVGPDAVLDLYDVAGTVAYDGRGRPSSWQVRVEVAAGGRLRWSGEPFVVADGADVFRSLDLRLGAGASVAVRETLVLGRSGQVGGRLQNCTSVTVDAEPVLLEDQMFDAAGLRRLPGLLGSHRVVDTILTVGETPAPDPAEVPVYRLLGGVGWVQRFLGPELATSQLHARWRHTAAPVG
jgi:urease accessory protein